MIYGEMNYLERIELYEKIKDQLTHEINMIEEQVSVSQLLEDDIIAELKSAEVELKESKKNMLREKMILEKEEAKEAKLNYFCKSKLEVIEDLKQELSDKTNNQKRRNNLKLDFMNTKELRQRIIPQSSSIELDELAELIKRKKHDTKLQLENLKKRLKDVLSQ